MSRYFAIQSWVSSHDNEPDYSGQQTGSRDVRSVEIPMFTQHGRANVDWFSDEQIALRSAANKPKPTIKDKILPQAKRLTTLRQQMGELEQEYKTTDMSIHEYSVLRDVLFAKAQRAEVLYRKAIAQKPVQTPEDEAETHYTNAVNTQPNDGYASEEYEAVGVEFIDQLSSNNSFKKPLKIACTLIKTAVRWHQAVRNYYLTLKAL